MEPVERRIVPEIESCRRRDGFDEGVRLRENKMVPSLSLGAVPPQSGPVAQLGARFHGMEEVVGSIPTRSTNSYRNLDRQVSKWRRLRRGLCHKPPQEPSPAELIPIATPGVLMAHNRWD